MKNILIFLASILIVLVIFAFFFGQIDTQNNTFAIDWKNFYPSLQGGDIKYLSKDGVLFPPWALITLLPLGFLPVQISWGVMAGISTIILLFSVPQIKGKALYWISCLLVLASYPSFRNMADGNVEGVVIGGVLLILYGYQSKNLMATIAGVILATIKFQEIGLFLLAWGLFILFTWRPYTYLKIFIPLLIIVGISLLWRGETWFAVLIGAGQKYADSVVNITLSAVSHRIGLPPVLFLCIWVTILIITVAIVWKIRPTFSREIIGMLIASSLLLSPYAATNSVLTVLAIGVIPLFQSSPLIGGILILLFDIPLLFSADALYNFQATYWTSLLFITWLILSLRILFLKRVQQNPILENALELD